MLRVTLDNAQSGGAQINLLEDGKVLAQTRLHLLGVKVEAEKRDGIELLTAKETELGEVCDPLFTSKSVSRAMFGHLVGKTKEVIEASIPNPEQCKAMKNVMADMMFKWWHDIDDGEGTTIYPGTSEYIDK